MMLFQNSTGPKKVIPKLISPKRCYPKTRQGREISFQNWSGPKDIIPKLISPRRCYPKTCQGRQMLSQNLSGPKDCIPKMVSPKRCYPKTCQGRDMLFQNWSGLGAGRWGGNKNVWSLMWSEQEIQILKPRARPPQSPIQIRSGPQDVVPELNRTTRCCSRIDQDHKMLFQKFSGPQDVVSEIFRTTRCCSRMIWTKMEHRALNLATFFKKKSIEKHVLNLDILR